MSLQAAVASPVLTRRRTSALLVGTAFFVAVLLAFGRGVFEAADQKVLGYAVQLAAWSALTLILANAAPVVRLRRAGTNLAVFYGFFLVSVVSAAYSYLFAGATSAWLYEAVMLVYGFGLYVYASRRFTAMDQVDVAPMLAVIAMLVVGVAVAQQFLHVDVLPGSDTGSLGGGVRPSSLTGSYLHYPIALAIVAAMLWQAASSSRSKVYAAAAAVSTAAVVVSYSRSGVLIVVVTVVAYGLLSRSSGTRARWAYVGVLIIAPVVWLLREQPMIARAATSMSPDAVGNQVRIDQWSKAIDLWSSSPLIIGSGTGTVTNVTENLSSSSSTVVESGALQQLVNFGLLGVLAFYALLLCTFLAVDPSHRWIRAALIGAAVQSLFYQSVEVFPFMFLIAISPLVSDNLLCRVRASGAVETARDLPGAVHRVRHG